MSQRAPPRRREPDDDDEEDGDDPQFSGETDPLDVAIGKRWTHDPLILVHEARMMADGKDIDNPALPINETVADQARRRIEQHDIDVEPLWRDITEYPDLVEGIFDE